MISIIVPTYREAENIPPLAKSIHASMSTAHMEYEIIIVDDNSDDGTVMAVDALHGRYPVKLIVRTAERGLSSAVIEGFRHAMGDILVVMDADLSHPPEKIPDLVRSITHGGADFAIGSRFTAGGSAEHFNPYRKLNALVSRLMARPLTAASDPMTGFFAFHRNLLPDPGLLNPVGFKIGLEMIVKAGPRVIAEVPIRFSERLHGSSKLSLREQVNYLVHLKRLYEYRFATLTEALTFGLVGASGTLVDLTMVYLSVDLLSLPFRAARVAGFMVAVTSNFFLNRRFTFTNGARKGMLSQYGGFVAVSMAGFIVNWLVSVTLHESWQFFNTHYLAAAFAGVVCGMTINFIGSKFLVFNNRT
jgi:dolichol-phosphate mannosyltransferase